MKSSKPSRQVPLFDVGAPTKYQRPAPCSPVEKVTADDRRRRSAELRKLGFKPIGDGSGSEVEWVVQCYRCNPPWPWTTRLTRPAMTWFRDHAAAHDAAGHTELLLGNV